MNDRPNEEYEELILAGFWRRFFALVVDLVLLLAIAFLTKPPVDGSVLNFDGESLLIFIITLLLISTFYFIIFWLLLGQTIGNLMMDIKIIRKDARKLTIGTVAVRYVMFLISLLPLGLGLWWIAFDSYHQGWHDKVAKTYVVKTPKTKKQENGEPTPA